MSKVYRVSQRVTAQVKHNGYSERYEVVLRYGGGVGCVTFTKRSDADRALAALAREFGWEEVPSE